MMSVKSKNIHVLPTEKESALVYTALAGYQITTPKFTKSDLELIQAHYENIYITSNEEINSNTYCLINGVLCKTELLEDRIVSRQLVGGATMDICKREYLEIILTTDQDLIKDGVQAIDDEFLEWFVKNPSYEFVKIKIIEKMIGSFNEKGTRPIYVDEYKIIIPKEEPKQETLEEVAKEIFKEEYICNGIDIAPAWREGFVTGAKWQQEQDKNKYSEDEVELIANEMVNWAIDNIGNPFPQSGKKFDEVIAKFKKK